ncbi:MAG: nuclear transport factor 2 family protein [Caulobacteraceae bacterium]
MLAALLGSPGAASPVTAASPQADEASLRAANASELADFMAADTKGLDGLWADGFVVTNPLNRLATKAQVLGMVGAGVLRFTSLERTIEYLRFYGDIAIVAGTETAVWSGKMPMAGKASQLRFTAVWQRSARGWREIARHANIIPDR